MTEYHGIDYGMGRTNRDAETGIRFGVIPMNDLGEWSHDSFEDDYGNPQCPKCGHDAVGGDSDRDESTRDEDKDVEEGELSRDDYEVLHHACGDYACDDCRILFDGENAFGDEPVGSYLDADGYLAERHSDGDVFILRSPYYTHAQFCSPCAPGACYLPNPVDESGPKAYCFGPDWFGKDRPCPYPVFSVATGECVYRPES